MATSTAEHPRPQLTRPGWEDLSGAWEFAYGDYTPGASGG